MITELKVPPIPIRHSKSGDSLMSELNMYDNHSQREKQVRRILEYNSDAASREAEAVIILIF